MMRRKEKEIKERAAIDDIIRRSSICRLGMSKDEKPYVVPLCFGYDGHALYFHSAREGKKVEILGENSNVCFEFDMDQRIKESDRACEWGMDFLSVIGYGKASFIDDPDLKRKAFDIIMAHYSGSAFTYREDVVEKTAIIRVDIEHMTGKRSGQG